MKVKTTDQYEVTSPNVNIADGPFLVIKDNNPYLSMIQRVLTSDLWHEKVQGDNILTTVISFP